MGRRVKAVLADLRQAIDKLAPVHGDRLPPERELRGILGCSRETLRACYATLEQEGEIWRHVGQGTYRGHRPVHMPLRDTLLVEGATPPDLMQARLLLEPQVAAVAALRADESDVVHLRSKVGEGRDARDRAACEQADNAFHRAVAETSRNPVLTGFLIYVSGARRRVAWQREWDRTYRSIAPDEFQTIHSDQHDRVVDAIAAADPRAAASAMTDHLKTIEAAMLDKD
ncbi:FadR/GntR family transcriptional regulator [Leisingera methylohalidivorans]|uniref:GntR family transcriptional regulator n=1 Tax=Leisingera methylohalidivorans DSM 14336 TaxID=999552 RepID=V9VW71_9RHOB|nr:FCD domain-containing protein [Leisingera methylohalidivorans]AHD02203.1 GntR family transcriptional regulator [Leisingera methylohalidivorans DSM 14336]